jgi:hypothetical protein
MPDVMQMHFESQITGLSQAPIGTIQRSTMIDAESLSAGCNTKPLQRSRDIQKRRYCSI